MMDAGISLSPSYRQLSNEFRFESKRLQTFRNWPVDAPIESARVAKAGFFFTGNGCEVQCFACSGKISSWDYGDQAVSKHRQMNPSCPFILNRSSNVPLHSETDQPAQSPTSPQSPLGSSQDESHSEGYNSDAHTPHTPVTPLSNPDPSIYGQPMPPPVQRNPGGRSYLSQQEWVYLQREDVRLRSYDDRFTANFLNPLSLAQSGFFYLGVADHVQCAFCRGVVRDWEAEDDPRREHERLFPSCPFILGLPVGNVPLGQDPPNRGLVERTASLPVTQGFGASQRFTPQMRPNASPDTEIGPSSNRRLNALIGDNLEELGITKHSGPRYATYATVESRLKSFNHWPTHLKQTPRAMAQAGFFYLGTNDHVNCFHCGSGLRNWEPNDDPWLEHARWFPQCRFLVLMKGEQYVKEASESVAASTRNADARTKPPPPLPLALTSNTPRPLPREVNETELRALLESSISQTVLAMGVDLSRVKQAYQIQIRTAGQPFTTVDSLLEAAIEVQHSSEHRQALEDQDYEIVDWPDASHRNRQPIRATPEGTSWPATHEDTHPRTEHVEMETEAKPSTPIGCSPSTSSETAVDRTQVLEEEIRRLKEARLCKVCLDEEVSIAYIPCGHIVTCVQCAAALDHCPLCRKNIKGTVRIFFS